MKLQDILFESTIDLTKHVILSRFLSPNQASKVSAALERLSAFQTADNVYNVEVNEVKSTLSRAFEMTLKAIERQDHDAVYQAKDNVSEFYDISYYVQFNQTGKQIRLLTKAITHHDVPVAAKKIFAEMLEANKAAAEVKVVLDSLKGKTISGRKPVTQHNPNAFQSRPGNKDAREAVQKAISPAIAPQLDQYETQVKEYFQGLIDSVKKMDTYTFTYKKRDPMLLMVMQRCYKYETKRTYDREGTATLSEFVAQPTAQTFAAIESRSQRDSLEQQFLYKNIRKLSQIVELKGNLSKIEVLPAKPVKVRAGSGTLEAGFVFSFDDGSRFTVVNKIVTKYTETGKPFEQFPTTFHDVLKADGTKMKFPSEEKMVKEFTA